MRSRVSIIQRISALGSIPHLVVLLGATVAAWGLLPQEQAWWALAVGPAIYLLISLPLRLIVTSCQRRGARYLSCGDLVEAIDAFKESYAFFNRRKWLDRCRHLLLLSASRTGYREKALCSIGFCYEQYGNVDKAEGYYQRALDEFPGSIVATISLDVLRERMKRRR